MYLKFPCWKYRQNDQNRGVKINGERSRNSSKKKIVERDFDNGKNVSVRSRNSLQKIAEKDLNKGRSGWRTQESGPKAKSKHPDNANSNYFRFKNLSDFRLMLNNSVSKHQSCYHIGIDLEHDKNARVCRNNLPRNNRQICLHPLQR